jgi:hypothetical protein
MKNAKKIIYLSFFLLTISSCMKNDDFSLPDIRSESLKEVEGLLASAAKERNVSKEEFMKTLVDVDKFTAQQNVFFPSALAIDFTNKLVTLPLYKGIGPSGNPTYYIVTESADFDVAKSMGVNFAPKLINGVGSNGSQQVTIENGMIRFKGDVDFSPVRSITPGPFPNTFPPATAQPGAVGDAEYSPLIILPSGTAMSVSIVSNSSGNHDHLVSIDRTKGTGVFELLDGFQGGEQYYFHLVTESSDMGAATIERGTYTPRLANLTMFGKSMPNDKSALLGFAPTANGETGTDNPERQGLNSTILDGIKYDPINVFPLDPENNKKENNNYSPMWDAHIYVWTDAAIQAGKRRRVKSIQDLQQLFAEGSVTNAPANVGDPNPLVAGLKPSKAIINCPVIAQPKNL